MTTTTEKVLNFCASFMRDTGLAPLSIKMPEKLFERIWHENQDRVTFLVGDDFAKVEYIRLYHFGGEIEITSDKPKVIEFNI